MANASTKVRRTANYRTVALARRRRQLLKVLLDPRPMLMGTAYTAYQRCGNPTCHCARDRGHPKTLLVYQARGRRRCKLVRKADVVWVRAAAERYRAFRTALRALRVLTVQEVEAFETLARSRAIEYE